MCGRCGAKKKYFFSLQVIEILQAVASRYTDSGVMAAALVTHCFQLNFAINFNRKSDKKNCKREGRTNSHPEKWTGFLNKLLRSGLELV
jgi:hypothetical protein